jgi:hypothetical protein
MVLGKTKLVCCVLMLGSFIAYPSETNASLSVAAENQLPGTADWQIAPIDVAGKNPDGSVDIEGYASSTSVNLGGSINFYVRTTQGSFGIKVFRVGYYNGLGGRLVHEVSSLQGSVQTPCVPDSTGFIECHWTSSYVLPIDPAWTSGVYLAKLIAPTGKQRYVIFVVRDDARPSAVLMQASVTTYQAYNQWGGRSLYSFQPYDENGNRILDGNGNPVTILPAQRVSFNRPYAADWYGSRRELMGAGDFFREEVNMVRWLERNGHDVTYVTNIDTGSAPDMLLTHKVFLSVGHDEYWSWSMRANLERALANGVSLGFFTANAGYWQVRLEPAALESGTASVPDRTMIGYKHDVLTDPVVTDTDPSNDRYATGRWRDAPTSRPEADLLGVQYIEPSSSVVVGDMKVVQPGHWLFADTQMSFGDTIPNLLGHEIDAIHPASPPGILALADSRFPKGVATSAQTPAHMTIYTAESGALVLAVGTIHWSLALDSYRHGYHDPSLYPQADLRVQQMTANFVARAVSATPDQASARLAAGISASGAAPGYPINNANDGDPGTLWMASSSVSTGNNHAWVQLDLGSRRHIDQIHWSGGNGSISPASSPAAFAILLSDDGFAWTRVLSRDATNVMTSGTEPIDNAARFVRFVSTRVADGTGWALSFYELWAQGRPARSMPGRLRPTLVTSTPSSVNGPPVKADDRRRDTYWESTTSPSLANPVIVQLDLGRGMHVNRVRWRDLQPVPTQAGVTVQYLVAVSLDGINWRTPVNRMSSNASVIGEEPLNEYARYISLSMTGFSNGGSGTVKLSEFWVEGQDRLIPVSATSGSSNLTALLDRNVQTWWQVDPPVESTVLTMDFETRKLFGRFGWFGGHIGVPNANSQSPSDYTIETSENGSQWFPVGTPRTNVTGIAAGDEAMTPLTNTGRFLRLATTKVNDGSGWRLSLADVWAEGWGAPNVAAASEVVGRERGYAVDGNVETLWLASATPASANNNSYYQVDLGERRRIRRVRWQGCVPGQAPYPAASPTNYRIDVSDDGATWQTGPTRTNSSAVANGDEVIDLAGRFVRLTTTQVNDGTGWALAFREFWVEVD